MPLTKSTSTGLKVRIDSSLHDDEMAFEERLPPGFLDLPSGDELSPVSDICVSGKAYHASEWILIQAEVTARMRLPCAVCNEMYEFSVELMPWKLSVPASSVKDGMLDVSSELREAILLEVPFFVRCGGDTCLNAEQVSKYFVPEGQFATDDGEERNQPFLSLL
jgi:uncharacterized metal-binding protein YceD (DUF177 family)